MRTWPRCKKRELKLFNTKRGEAGRGMYRRCTDRGWRGAPPNEESMQKTGKHHSNTRKEERGQCAAEWEKALRIGGRGSFGNAADRPPAQNRETKWQQTVVWKEGAREKILGGPHVERGGGKGGDEEIALGPAFALRGSRMWAEVIRPICANSAEE